MTNWYQNQVRINATPDIIKKIREFVSCENPIKKTSWFDLKSYERAMYKDYYDFVEKRHNAEPLPLSLNSIVPQPENIFKGNVGRKEIEKCKLEGRPTWYVWNVKNWGTKWDVCDAKLTVIDNTEIVYSFMSAWSPPIYVFMHLADLFPDSSIIHTFAELDMKHAGIREYTSGELTRCEDDDIQVIEEEAGFDVVGPIYVLDML